MEKAPRDESQEALNRPQADRTRYRSTQSAHYTHREALPVAWALSHGVHEHRAETLSGWACWASDEERDATS